MNDRSTRAAARAGSGRVEPVARIPVRSSLARVARAMLD
jgi:hypothetical protein